MRQSAHGLSEYSLIKRIQTSDLGILPYGRTPGGSYQGDLTGPSARRRESARLPRNCRARLYDRKITLLVWGFGRNQIGYYEAADAVI